MAVAELTVTAKSGDSRPGTSEAPVMEPTIVEIELPAQEPSEPGPSDDEEADTSGDGDADGSGQGPSDKQQPPKHDADRPRPGMPRTGA